jgi:hypothetical protein
MSPITMIHPTPTRHQQLVLAHDAQHSILADSHAQWPKTNPNLAMPLTIERACRQYLANGSQDLLIAPVGSWPALAGGARPLSL